MRCLWVVVGAVLSWVAAAGPAAAAADTDVFLLEVEGPITPVVSDYIADGIEEAAERSVPVIVRLDTPGGLDVSMREIVQSFLNAPVPVIVYVAPEGARAASAGTFITMAAHVAAMAPATSIGAATPVDLQGGEITDKIINDAAAFAVSVAERRGRDVEFAEDAVRDGASITASEAVERGVVDLVASDLDELLVEIDGMEVVVRGETTTLHTARAVAERYEVGAFRKVLARIADPNIAFLLLSFGTLAIVYEAANPGLGFAGIVGVISILLGFFALSVLPVTAVGVALLILAAALFIGEIFVPGVGVLAAGGTISLLLAGLFLFEDAPSIRAPILWPTALILGAASLVAGRMAWRARRAPSTTGIETLIGREVVVRPRDTSAGDAFVDGAWWRVRAESGELAEGPAEVVDIDGLTLIVRGKRRET
ncbi:MAG TPA: nodulation protein NfeD [Acidimicrobiia bacterium]|nr:nodulation protein NfeD [Acidimicrobiia bacterium]